MNDDFKINEAGLTKISSTFCEARFDGGIHESQHFCTYYTDVAGETCMSGVGGGIWCDADGYPGVGVNIAEFYGWLKATITRAPVCQP